MIERTNAYAFCREDISLIENYYEALTDTEHRWHVHHRDEIRTLPCGITVIRTAQDLKEAGRYYNCPANELIFLTVNDHMKLHRKFYKSGNMKGHTHSEESRRKMSEGRKGKGKGRIVSDETKAKLRQARLNYLARSVNDTDTF